MYPYTAFYGASVRKRIKTFLIISNSNAATVLYQIMGEEYMYEMTWKVRNPSGDLYIDLQ